MKVLVAENNQQTLQQLCDLLEKEGYEVLRANGGQSALEAWEKAKPDFICLDIMMPDLSGFEVCREIRKSDKRVPVIFISAKNAAIDKITGLEIGADDYIVKPFDMAEVSARIRAVARRCLAASGNSKQATSFRMHDVTVFPGELRAEKKGKILELSLRDAEILKLFHDNKGKVIERNVLLDKCWGAHIMPESRTIDWHIAQLRKKLENDPKNPEIIKTVHGAGYRYDDS